MYICMYIIFGLKMYAQACTYFHVSECVSSTRMYIRVLETHSDICILVLATTPEHPITKTNILDGLYIPYLNSTICMYTKCTCTE